jgi:hypothetical protein
MTGDRQPARQQLHLVHIITSRQGAYKNPDDFDAPLMDYAILTMHVGRRRRRRVPVPFINKYNRL